MNEAREILLKLHRRLSFDETNLLLQARIKELEVQVGKDTAYITELEDTIKDLRKSPMGSKQKWLTENEYIAQLNKQIGEQNTVIVKLKNENNKWMNKYLQTQVKTQ